MAKQIQTKLLISLFSTLFLIIVGFPIFASEQSTHFRPLVEEPVELKYKLQAGDVLTYKTEMDITSRISSGTGIRGGYTKQEINTTLTVTQIAADGIITAAVIAEAQIKKSLMNGKNMTKSVNKLMKESGMQYQLDILKIRPDGHDLSTLIQNPEPHLSGWIALPEEPIKIGDSWPQKLSLMTSPGLEPKLDSLTATLMGFERVGKYNSAKIELTTPEQETDVPERNEGKITVFFALSEGFPVKVEGMVKSKSASEMELEAHWNTKLTKVSKLKPKKLNQARSELSILANTLEQADSLNKSDEETRSALEKFVSDYPKSFWRKGVDGLIARFGSKKPDSTTLDEQPEDVSGNIDEYLSSLGIAKSGGQMADDFTLETIAGKQVSLSDYRGKIVFLNFWATWCPPCRREAPSMEKLYRKFKDRNFIILAVSLRENSGKVSKFMRDNKLSFPALLDSKGKVGGQYGISSIPTTFFVDKNGKIIGRAVGGRDWASEVSFKLIKALLETN